MAAYNRGFIGLLVAIVLLHPATTEPPVRSRPPPRISWRGAEMTTVFTSDKHIYNSTWFTVEDQYTFVFKVKACAGASLALAKKPTTEGTDAIEIAIGDSHNTVSEIRDVNTHFMSTGQKYFTTQTSHILNCYEYRAFWVSWKNNNIEVGRGPTPSLQKFMNYKADDIFPIKAIGLSTGHGYTGAWKMAENSGDGILQFTPSDYRFEYFWRTVEDTTAVSFSVRSCSEVRIVLTEIEGNINYNSYEIAIGFGRNGECTIKKRGNGFMTHGDCPEVLSCTTKKFFWIGWNENVVELGRGRYYKENSIVRMAVSDVNVFVQALSISSFGSNADWYFEDMLEGATIISTDPSNGNKFKDMWLSTPRKKFATFLVKACQNIRIAIAQNKMQLDDYAYVIEIGMNENTKTGLRHAIDPGWKQMVETPNILDCNNMKSFWLSWSDGSIVLGRGYLADPDTKILQFSEWKEHPVGAIGIASGPPTRAEWSFKKSAGELMTFYTSDKQPEKVSDLKIWRHVATQQVVHFSVKAGSDAHIFLAANERVLSNQAVEIIIGGWKNKESVIRDEPLNKSSIQRSTKTPDILSDTESRTFWIGWVNGFLQVGRGYTFRAKGTKFLHWQMKRPFPVNYISLSSGWGFEAEWEFEENTGDKLSFSTPDAASTYKKLVSISQNSLVFHIKACKQASLYLGSETSKVNEVLIGGDANNVCKILDRDSKEIDTRNTPEILSCNEAKPFWVRWENGKIDFGRGMVVGVGHILRASQQIGTSIDVVKFKTGPGASGNWMIRKGAVQEMRYDTSDTFSNYEDGVWIGSTDKEYCVFSVKACKEVFILLSSLQGFPSKFAYEIVIGGWKNSRNVIRQKGWDANQYYVANGDKLLDCNEYRDFWVSWKEGHIVFGKGDTYGNLANRVMDWIDQVPHRVQSVAFSTGFGATGEWKFPISDALQPTPPTVTPNTATMPPTVTEITEYPPSSRQQSKTRLMSGGSLAGLTIGIIIAAAIIMIVVFLATQRSARERVLTLPGFNKFKRFENA